MARRRGNIETLGPGRYRIRIYLHTDELGKQHYHREIVHGSKADAQKRLTAVLREIDTGAYVAPAPITVAEYLDRWITEAVRPYRKPKTVATYERACSEIKATLGHVPLQRLRPLDLQAHYRRRLEAGLSPSTVSIDHRTVHKALEDAVRWGLIARNVADAVEAPKTRKRTGNVWTSEQLAAFLDHVSGHRLYALFALAATAGLRRGELCGMRRTDVDLDRLTLRITRTRVVVDGKCIFQESAKTEASERPMSISPAVGAILRAHLRQQAEERLMFGPDYQDHECLFCHPDGRPLRPDGLTSKVFPTLCRDAGVPRIRFHDLRHTYATELLRRKYSTRYVQHRMRHTRPETTVGLYQHVTEEMDREAAAAMDDVLPQGKREKEQKRRPV